MFRPYFTIPININGMPVYYNIPYFVENQKKKVIDDDLLNTLKKYIDDELNKRDNELNKQDFDKENVKKKITKTISSFFNTIKEQNAKIKQNNIETTYQNTKLKTFQKEINDKIDAQFMLNQLITQINEKLTPQLFIDDKNNDFKESNNIINTINTNIDIIKKYNININYITQLNTYIQKLNTTYSGKINDIMNF